jgi:long-chain acyl-CoA synthetase
MKAEPATPATTELDYFRDLASRGMLLSHWARVQGERPAIQSRRGTRTFAELNGAANRLLAHWRRAGVRTGGGVALLCGNTPEFIETLSACQRGGMRFTPINWHLSPAEIAYILADCEAEAWVVHGDLVDKIPAIPLAGVKSRLTIGRPARGYDDYAEAIALESAADTDDPVLGRTMLYTSGTTGKPKGVVKGSAFVLVPQREGTNSRYRDGDAALLSGPAYHGGPLTFDIAFPLASGATIVMMEKFNPLEMLALIERHRITHAHLVSTMFQRLLALPEEQRRQYDLSSLRMIVHGAAPTPPEVKRSMIDWLGPVLFEYYAATEASANIHITSEEWLRKPGSVGRILPESGACVLDDDGKPCSPGVAGRVSFRNDPAAPTRYFKAEDKNREVFGASHFTVGDIGYVDDEGYLFLTGRSAETIISGGVNIYPQEIDNALLRHSAVRQSCTVGVPNREWGEEVRGVIALNDGFTPSPALAEAILDFARGELARYKLPRAIDFVEEVPQSEAGKTLRTKVRAPYWAGHDRQI